MRVNQNKIPAPPGDCDGQKQRVEFTIEQTVSNICLNHKPHLETYNEGKIQGNKNPNNLINLIFEELKS